MAIVTLKKSDNKRGQQKILIEECKTNKLHLFSRLRAEKNILTHFEDVFGLIYGATLIL